MHTDDFSTSDSAITIRRAMSSIGIGATVPWSVCLSARFVHCAQTAEDIDTTFLHSKVLCLSQTALKFS